MTILSFCLNLVISHVTHVTATLQQHIRFSRLYTGIYTSESLDDLKQVLLRTSPVCVFLTFYKTSKAHIWPRHADQIYQMYARGSCKTTTFWSGVLARAADCDGTQSLTGFATASHTKGVTITASQGGEYMYTQSKEQRNGSDGWTRTSNGRINGAVPYH